MHPSIKEDIFIHSMTISIINNVINIPMHVLISNYGSISGKDNWIT